MLLLSHDDLHQNTRPSNIFRDMCHKGRNLSIHEMSYIVCIIHTIVSTLSSYSYIHSDGYTICCCIYRIQILYILCICSAGKHTHSNSSSSNNNILMDVVQTAQRLVVQQSDLFVRRLCWHDQ
jgi:hypothetical protein